MNEFLITYWKEYNDQSTDIEVIVKAKTLSEALDIFKRKTLYYSYVQEIKLIIK